MDRGIQPVTWDRPDRSKWWLFANGVTLNKSDGSLVVLEQTQEVARDLVTAVDEAKQGTFQPQKENDELARALKNPEHPGQAHGIGVVPWKVAWAGDSSYKTHQKCKAEQDKKIHALQEEMNEKVVSLKSQMDARVNEAVQLALSQQRATVGSQPVLAFLMPRRICIPLAHRITAVALHFGVFQGIAISSGKHYG